MGVFCSEENNSVLEVDKVAPFLLKLYEIVSSPVSDDLVCWSEHGETFKIVNRTKFAGDVLPLYFKHDNLRSFIRQLNIYGFQRCTNAPGRDNTMEFFHPSFTRHGARDLKDIKRGNQLKSSKRHDMEENGFNEGPDENSSSSGQSGTHKRMRIDYSIFRTDVARLQQNLDDLESDLKQHSMQVQEKLALILRALDDAPMAEEPSAGVAEAAHRLQNGLDPSVPHSGAEGLNSASLQSGLQHSSNNASTGNLTASTAAGSASSANPPPGGGAGGGGGALSSSRDLAAAYLAAAGHHNPEEVIGIGSGSSGGSAAGTGLQPSAPALSQFGNHQRAIAAAATAAAAGLPSHFNTSVSSSTLSASLAASYAAATGSISSGLPGGLPGGGAGGGVGAPGGAPGGRWCDGWGTPQLNNGGATASASLPLSGGAPNSAAALTHQLALQRGELLAPAGARLGLQGLYGSRSLDAQREPAAAQS